MIKSKAYFLKVVNKIYANMKLNANIINLSFIYRFTDSIDSDTTLIMANALHFQCSWSSPFLETSEEFFNVTSNRKITAKMMKKNGQLKYFHDDILKFSALQLPYLVRII